MEVQGLLGLHSKPRLTLTNPPENNKPPAILESTVLHRPNCHSLEPTQILQQWNLPRAQPNIYLDSVFQGWSQKMYSPVTTCSKKIQSYMRIQISIIL